MTSPRDTEMMARALFFAERGRGRTSPNPIVGAVVTDADGVVRGQGAHLGAGLPHAEVVALDQAGAAARGGTVYTTLEPCAHRGRTGPCVERLVEAGVSRVVAAIQDPNPRVAGAGFGYLRDHDVEVVEGIGRSEAAWQNAPFLTWVTRRRPHVTLKAALSRDGFVGQRGTQVRLTGSAADRFFHRQRAAIDAIAVGSETVLNDDPLLTARGAYRHQPLIRVLFDWRARVPATARVFSTLDRGPVIMFVCETPAGRDTATLARLAERGVIIERCAAPTVAGALERLAARDVLALLVEGGPTLHAAFAEAGVVDRVQWVMTARSLGHGVPAARGLTHELRWTKPPALTRLGQDLLIEFDVHRTD